MPFGAGKAERAFERLEDDGDCSVFVNDEPRVGNEFAVDGYAFKAVTFFRSGGTTMGTPNLAVVVTSASC